MDEAPYEVASDYRTVRVGDYLYLDGKVYKCPTLTPEMAEDVARSIRRALNICENDCKGLKRLWHKLTRNVGHSNPAAPKEENNG